jgi:alpha-tubulin suppressor-like RCC1 family protein
VAAGLKHSLALTWEAQVYSWGDNRCGQLGHGDKRYRPSPVLMEELEGLRGIAADSNHSLAVTQAGAVFSWGRVLPQMEDWLRPRIVEGFDGVRISRVCAGNFAIGEDGELFSWGSGGSGTLGHGDEEDRPSPKRVEALQGVRISCVSVHVLGHAVALAEEGLVYAWGDNAEWSDTGNSNVEMELLPKPVEALRGVRIGSVATACRRGYAVADTGLDWAWGCDRGDSSRITLLGENEQVDRPVPKSLESLRSIKADAVAADGQTLVLADDGSVYSWGGVRAASAGALGLGPSVSESGRTVPIPQRVPTLRVARGGL